MSRTLLKATASLWLLSAVAFGQSEVGGATINGTVTDQSGAAVPNAKVTISSPAIGLTRSTETSDVGLYSFPRLPVSTSELDTAGVVALVLAAVTSLVGALLGGIAGMRFHRRVDRVDLEGYEPVR